MRAARGYWRVADVLPLPQFSHEDATALCHSRLPTAHIRPPSQVLGPGREQIEHGDEHAHARAAAAAGARVSPRLTAGCMGAIADPIFPGGLERFDPNGDRPFARCPREPSHPPLMR